MVGNRNYPNNTLNGSGRKYHNNKNNIRGGGNRNQRNQGDPKKRKFQNNSFVENEKVVIKYQDANMSDDEVKTKFYVYGETNETTVMHQ